MKKKASTRGDVPGLAASTPYNSDDGVFGFETPSPKSAYVSPVHSPTQTITDDVLPHHYGGQEFFTPAEKFGTALRRIQSRLSSPFHAPRRRLEDRFNGYSHPASSRVFLPFSRKVVVLVVTVALGLVFWTTTMSWNKPSDIQDPSTFRFRPSPASNAPSRKALNWFRKAYKTNKGGWLGFDDPLNPGSIFCLVEQTGEATDRILVTDDETKEFALGFETYLVEHLTNLLHRMGHEEIQQGTGLVEVKSYFSLVEGFPHIAESQFATANGRMILAEIRFSVPPNAGDYSSSVIDTIQRYGKLHSPDYVDVRYTGLPLFQSEMVPASNEMRPLKTLLPSSAPSMIAYQHLSENFGSGRLSPYRITFDGRSAGRLVNTKETFEKMHIVMEAFAEVDANVAPAEEEIEEDLEMMMGFGAVNLDSIPQRTEDGHLEEHLAEVMDEMYGTIGFEEKDKILPIYGAHGRESFKSHQRTTYDGVAYVRNNPVPYPLFLASDLCLSHNKPYCPVELLHLFNYMSEAFTTTDGMTTYVEATLGFDPFAGDGVRWLEAAREKLQELSNSGILDGINVYIEGGAALEYDATHEIPTDWYSWSVLVWGVALLAVAVASKYAIVPLARRIRNRGGKDGKTV